jgi:hypothetical protein
VVGQPASHALFVQDALHAGMQCRWQDEFGEANFAVSDVEDVGEVAWRARKLNRASLYGAVRPFGFQFLGLGQ